MKGPSRSPGQSRSTQSGSAHLVGGGITTSSKQLDNQAVLGELRMSVMARAGGLEESESVIYGNKVLMSAMFPVSKAGAAGQEGRNTSQAASWCS